MSVSVITSTDAQQHEAPGEVAERLEEGEDSQTPQPPRRGVLPASGARKSSARSGQPEEGESAEPEGFKTTRHAPGNGAIELVDVSLSQHKKAIFGPVSIKTAPGSLLVIDGPVGSGRTCLLLTIGGRMKPTTGSGAVSGFDLRAQMKQIRRHVALGSFPGLNDLDPALSVNQHVAEQILLHKFGLSVGRARVRETLDTLNQYVKAAEPLARDAHAVITGESANCDKEFLPRLRGNQLVADLTPLEKFTLSTLLSLLDEPDVLLVDDVDELRAVDDRARAWALLIGLRTAGRERPLTIVASCEHDGLDPTALADLSQVAGGDHLIYDLPGCRLEVGVTSPAAPTAL
ncbi:ATP-binding cassette domain-containing protein [Propionibacterium sp.]|uniref:ATP-binding cassette domain-containing protein n=1 Tax=Propionibacterium sp. TaxID=1977903 RepID=UPI0039E7DFF6